MCSMMSVQCDELRAMAESVGLEIPKVATLMMEAADIIDRLDAENANLRKRVAELEELLPDSGRWYRAETVEAYVAENAKLRELVRDLYAEYGFAHARMRYIVLQHEKRMREIEQRMRELGADE